MPPVCTNLALYRVLLSLNVPEKDAAAAAEVIVAPAPAPTVLPRPETRDGVSSGTSKRGFGRLTRDDFLHMTSDELHQRHRQSLVRASAVLWVDLGLIVTAGVLLPLPFYACAVVILIFVSDRVLDTIL